MYNSPCNKQCHLINSTCKGCLRTIDEIANWSLLSNEKKLRYLTELRNKKRSLG